MTSYDDYYNGIERGEHGFIICPFCDEEMPNNECSKCGYHQMEIEQAENQDRAKENEVQNDEY